MKIPDLNSWLTFLANLGVIAGIVFLGLEIQQTRTALVGEFHANRAVRSNEITQYMTENNLVTSFANFTDAANLTAEERETYYGWSSMLLRHFEDIQFQRNLDLVEDEVWESNLRAMRTLTTTPAFSTTFPEWPAGPAVLTFSNSFVDLISTIIEDNGR